MTVAVTGATGHLGRLAVSALLDRGVAPDDVVAVVRDPGRAADLAERGVQVRHGDFDIPDTLASALVGVDRLLLVSGSELGRRVVQHQSVVDAAVAAAVGHLAYTSIPKADTTPMLLAAEHRATEELIRASGLPYTFLRNSWYLENYTAQLPSYLEQGELVGSAGDGLISAATRADYAEAGAVVLSTTGHEGAVYELGGDIAFTMSELAASISEATGRDLAYRNLPSEEHLALLEAFGLPPEAAAVYADADTAVSRGDLHVTSGDLSRLIGHPTTTLSEAVRSALLSFTS